MPESGYNNTDLRWVLYSFISIGLSVAETGKCTDQNGPKNPDSSYKYATSLNVPKARVSQVQYPIAQWSFS